MASLKLNEYREYTTKKQISRRKIPGNERKLNLKDPSPKAKKNSHSQVLQIILCHISEYKIELIFKKKKIVHQRKMPDIALHIFVSNLITPHVKKYFFNNLVLVILDLKRCEHLKKEQNKSLYTESINYTSCTVE